MSVGGLRRLIDAIEKPYSGFYASALIEGRIKSMREQRILAPQN